MFNARSTKARIFLFRGERVDKFRFSCGKSDICRNFNGSLKSYVSSGKKKRNNLLNNSIKYSIGGNAGRVLFLIDTLN